MLFVFAYLCSEVIILILFLFNVLRLFFLIYFFNERFEVVQNTAYIKRYFCYVLGYHRFRNQSLPSKHSSWWRRLENVLETSFVFVSRRRLQFVLIKTNMFALAFRLHFFPKLEKSALIWGKSALIVVIYG